MFKQLILQLTDEESSDATQVTSRIQLVFPSIYFVDEAVKERDRQGTEVVKKKNGLDNLANLGAREAVG